MSRSASAGGRRSGPPVSSCDCRDCRAACLNSPGWFRPGQVKALAIHLGESIEDVFRARLAVGVTAMPDGSLRHGVMPHKLRDGKKPGSVWTLEELARPGRCVFYDRGVCTIYPVRPEECARMIHGARDAEAVAVRRAIVGHWTPQALAPFAALTGVRLFGAPPAGAAGKAGPGRKPTGKGPAGKGPAAESGARRAVRPRPPRRGSR
ncbi:hypothetical protein KDM41_02215 [bacterium]|nr:hypothetical protein [bacterium]